MELQEDDTGATNEGVSRSTERLALIMEMMDAAWFDCASPPGPGDRYGCGWGRLLGVRPEEVPDDVPLLEWLFGKVQPGDRERLVRSYAAFANGRTDVFAETFRIVHGDGSERWFESVGRAVTGPPPRRLVGVIRDVTAHKQHEARRETLIRELRHRAKNSLTVVQSLARQTFSSADDVGRALAAFEQRLQALAAAHDLLTTEQRRNVDLADVAATAIAGQPGDDRVLIDGPPVTLDSGQAVTMALALHELCTNATKYGALSNATGHVTLGWRIEDRGEPRLRIEWRERGGPPVVFPARRGFGSRLIERRVGEELRGSVSLEFHADGVVCTIEAPLPTGAPEP